MGLFSGCRRHVSLQYVVQYSILMWTNVVTYSDVLGKLTHMHEKILVMVVLLTTYSTWEMIGPPRSGTPSVFRGCVLSKSSVVKYFLGCCL